MSARVVTASGVAAVCVALLATSIARPTPWLLWNASASAPVGLYWVAPADALTRGELAVVRPPTKLASYLATRGYLPLGVPLVKHIAALAGARVCRTGDVVTVERVHVARALDLDRRGRPLPVWRGCICLTADQVFLLNPARPDSLDGRYFGALPGSSIVGGARPIWTFPDA